MTDKFTIVTARRIDGDIKQRRYKGFAKPETVKNWVYNNGLISGHYVHCRTNKSGTTTVNSGDV